MSAKRIKRKIKKEERSLIAGQWIEIEIIDGVARTTRYPDDAEFSRIIEQTAEDNGRPVDLVYRRMNFVHGVPPPYDWTTKDPAKRQHGGFAIQRLKVDDWRRLSKEEQGGHLKYSPHMQPRPEDRGVCECEGCLALAKRLQKS